MQFTNNYKHCLHITYLDVSFRHTKLTFYRYTPGTHNENSFSMQSCTTQIPSLTSKCKFKRTIKTLSVNAIRLYSTQICKRRHFKTCFFFRFLVFFFYLSFIIYILCTNKPIDRFYHTLYMRI